MIRILRNRAKRHQSDIDLKRELIILATWTATIMFLHVLAMRSFENLSFGDALWLTLTTITTVGYGDISATTVYGRASTVILMYIAGIYTVAQAVGLYFEYKTEKIDKIRKGHWKWHMKDHIVILNSPSENTVWYLVKLSEQLKATRSSLRSKQILIVSDNFSDGLPKELSDLGYVYQNAIPNNFKALLTANIRDASHIIALSTIQDTNLADAEIFDVVHRTREMNEHAMIVAEVAEDPNRFRIIKAGATVAIRPMRGYPEMLARSLIAPGSEGIIEKVFTSGGDECIRYDCSLTQMKWSDIMMVLVQEDIGIPLAYIHEGQTFINPSSNAVFSCDALFVLVKENKITNQKAVRTIIEDHLL